jgi:hypothetical protein
MRPYHEIVEDGLELDGEEQVARRHLLQLQHGASQPGGRLGRGLHVEVIRRRRQAAQQPRRHLAWEPVTPLTVMIQHHLHHVDGSTPTAPHCL